MVVSCFATPLATVETEDCDAVSGLAVSLPTLVVLACETVACFAVVFATVTDDAWDAVRVLRYALPLVWVAEDDCEAVSLRATALAVVTDDDCDAASCVAVDLARVAPEVCVAASGLPGAFVVVTFEGCDTARDRRKPLESIEVVDWATENDLAVERVIASTLTAATPREPA